MLAVELADAHGHLILMRVRKTLAVLSVLLHVVSLAAWITSYFRLMITTPNNEIIQLWRGSIDWLHPDPTERQLWKIVDSLMKRAGTVRVLGYDGLETFWWPQKMDYATGMMRIIIPLWIPTLLFAVPPILCVASWYRSRLRRKTGHCALCGYDLTGNESGNCPECGATVEECAIPRKP